MKQISYGNDLVVQAAKNWEKWVAIFYEPVKHCDFVWKQFFSEKFNGEVRYAKAPQVYDRYWSYRKKCYEECNVIIM